MSWNIDTAHSGIHFKVRHLVIAKVRGTFDKWTARLDLDEQDLTKSSVEVTIDAASIDTNEPQRDAHLRSPDFFDVEKYPTIRFASRRVERVAEDALRVVGDLTMHGVTREVALEVVHEGEGADLWGGRRHGFSARATIDRRDYGLTWNKVLDHGGLAVGDKVEIEIEIEAVTTAAKQAA